MKDFNVRMTIFYQNIVFNGKVPLIITRTSIKQSKHDVLNRQNIFFLLDKFLETVPETQFITMFSPWGINSWFLGIPFKVLEFENSDSKSRKAFLINGLRVYKEHCDSNFTVCKFKQLLRSQNLLWERPLQASTSFQSF